MKPRLIALLLTSLAALNAKEPSIFAAPILPPLREHCANCHRPGKTRDGLDVTTMEKLEKDDAAWPFVVASLAENNRLFRAISHIGDEKPMPLEQDKLPPSPKSSALTTAAGKSPC